MALTLIFLCLLNWAQVVSAKLPWGHITPITLEKTSTHISFDPLALLAVLHNPRAAASAARLYTQQHISVYRWPHLAMIGGTLAPFKLLIDHLVSQTRSVHPTVGLVKADVGSLSILSKLGFPSLPVDYGNFWLADLLDFPSSQYPQNDLLVVFVKDIHGKRAHGMNRLPIAPYFGRFMLNLIDYGVLALELVALISSILSGDMWATALFSVYLLHSCASTIVSFRRMSSTEYIEGRQIKEDGTIEYAVYLRPSGGKIVFKGRKDALETWARMSWTFQRSTTNNFIHWLWMITGSLAAAASVICMVNMAGDLQLAYLGVLIVSSMCEIGITLLVRRIQNVALDFGRSIAITSNEKWTTAVIRSALEVDDELSLAELPWIELGLFPNTQVFRSLCAVLPKLRSGSVAKSFPSVMQELERFPPQGGRGDQEYLFARMTQEILNTQPPPRLAKV